MSKKRLIWAIGALVAMGIIVGLFVSGYLYAGFKSPKSQLTVNPHICSADEIKKFNVAFGTETGAVISTTDVKSKDLIKSIQEKSAYMDDPSCVQMILLYQIRLQLPRNKQEAWKTYNRLDELVQKQLYPSPSIEGSNSLKTQKDILQSWDAIAPARGGNDQPEVGR